MPDEMEEIIAEFVTESEETLDKIDPLFVELESKGDDKEIPFLMVTAEAEKDKVITAIQAGVNNYIVKPFTAEVFNEKMDRIFEKLEKK